jgi:hypothetical protein
MDLVKIATWSELADREPVGVTVDGIDLVIIRQGDEHSVLYGASIGARCWPMVTCRPRT